LKYVEKTFNNNFVIDFDCYSTEKDMYFIIRDFQENRFWIFPNKPLHLYTEQEEKELLDLLLKLK
jgi:hypothetical protein